MCAAVRTVPPTTTDGNVQPIGPSTPSCSTSVATVADTASGVAGWGVTSRIRPVAVPVLMSTSAALMPEPPTSTPMRVCVVDIASTLVPPRNLRVWH